MQYNYFGYINSCGYSISAQEYIFSILCANPNANIKLNILNGGVGPGVSQQRKSFFESLVLKQDSVPQTNIFHCIPHRYRRYQNVHKHVGICVFETMNPDSNWISMMNNMDVIITASQFNKRIFETNGCNKPIHVVPHSFDPNLFNAKVEHKGRYRQFTFLSIATWKNRKNWSNLIKAFYTFFNKNDNVCLLAKTDKPKELEKAVKRIKMENEWRSKETCPIYYETKTNCIFEDIPAFMKKGDCFVSVSLGEGFLLSGLHSMALGIPVVLPKFGGVLEYAKPDNCLFIEPKTYKSYPYMDKTPIYKNCIWPVITPNDIGTVMRQAYENYPSEKIKTAYSFVHKNFTQTVIGQKMLEALS